MSFLKMWAIGFLYIWASGGGSSINVRESTNTEPLWTQVHITRNAADTGTILVNTEYSRTPNGRAPTVQEEYRVRTGGGLFGPWHGIPSGQFETTLQPTHLEAQFRWRFNNDVVYDPQSSYRVDIVIRKTSGGPVYDSANRTGTLFDFSDYDINGLRNYLDVYAWRRLGIPYAASDVKNIVIGNWMGNPNIRYCDWDGDGHCQFSDFVILSNNFGTSPGLYHLGDADLDYDVDFADFVIFANEFEGDPAAISPP
jgi:hypothetical protein